MAKKRGRPQADEKKPREGKPLNAWLPDALMDQFHAWCRATKRTKKAALEIMFETVLTAEGYWPPPHAPQAKE